MVGQGSTTWKSSRRTRDRFQNSLTLAIKGPGIPWTTRPNSSERSGQQYPRGPSVQSENVTVPFSPRAVPDSRPPSVDLFFEE